MLKRNVSEQELSHYDNGQLCYVYADLCPECGMLPRMLSVYFDDGEVRKRLGFIVECPFCETKVHLIAETRCGALRFWNRSLEDKS